MAAYAETNVRLPGCALEALSAVSARLGLSRDATVRHVLENYVAFQTSVADPESRVTHISTVLRYPPTRQFPGQPRSAKALRLRVPSPVLAQARELALQLPGQHQRGHRDYQARTLTDAVVTAIAIVEPFSDATLAGLWPLLRHRAALSLWQLAAAGTSTRPEKALLIAAHDARLQDAWASEAHAPGDSAQRRKLLMMAEALEEDVAWHSPERFKVVAYFARELLTGHDGAAGERLLFEQGEVWEDRYLDALHADGDSRERMLEGTTSYDFTGRGGAAVWRALRQFDLQHFEDWLLDRPDGEVEQVSDAIGWFLRTPDRWRAFAPAPASGRRLPEPFARWAAEGRVLSFPFHNRQAVWPLIRCPGHPGFSPVSEVEALLAAGAGLRPDKVSRFIEAVLVDWNYDFEEEPLARIALDLPVDKARDFGFITTREMHKEMALARRHTLATMDALIKEFEKEGELSQESLQRLRDERGHARAFGRLARQLDRRLGAKFAVTRAEWRWPGHSVVDAHLDGGGPALVECLAACSFRSSNEVLEQSMYEATRQAYIQYGFRM